MNRAILALFLFAGLAWSQDAAGADPIQLLNKLTEANAAKSVEKISMLTKEIAEVGKMAKAAEEVDPLASALADSLKICKGNHGTVLKIVDAMGELRSKKALSALKRIATKKKPKEGEEEEVQAHAILAVAKMADPKQVKGLADQTKQRSLIIAKAAYECFKHYGSAKGRVRKNIAEILMKRLEMEYPSQGKQGSGKTSGEAQKRWEQLSPVIVQSMQSICRQPTINDIENWREWWKDNKKNPRAWKDEKA